MAISKLLLLIIWQLIIVVSCIIVLILAILRYKEKKTTISATLTFAFLYFTMGIGFQVFGSILTYLDIHLGSFLIGNPDWFKFYIIHMIKNYQFAYIFLIMGLFMIFRFAMQLVKQNEMSWKVDRIALLFMFALILFGLLKPQFPLDDIDEIATILYSLDIWVILYSIMMVLPIIIQSSILLKRIEKTDPTYNRILWMFFVGIDLFLMMLGFILETVTGIFTGEYINTFSFIAFGLALVGIVLCYLAFYKKN